MSDYREDVRSAFSRRLHAQQPSRDLEARVRAAALSRRSDAGEPRLAVLVAALVVGALVAALFYAYRVTQPAAPAVHRAQKPPVTQVLPPPQDETVRGQDAFGAVPLANFGAHPRFKAFTLRVGPQANAPTTAPVWRTNVSLLPRASTVARALGVDPGASDQSAQAALQAHCVGYDQAVGALEVEGCASGFSFSRLPRKPRTSADVEQMTRAYLAQRGLLPADASQHVDASHSDAQTTPPSWGVYFHRYLDGYPAPGGVQMAIHEDGTIGTMFAGEIPIAGGSDYPLRSWQAAWARIAAGRYYAYDGAPLLANGVPTGATWTEPAFTADQVGVCYVDFGVGPVQKYLVPMWCFTDTHLGARVFYPAVTDQYLRTVP